MSKSISVLLGTGLALLLFFAVNVLANAGLRTVKVDLTEEKLFTLSDASKSLAANLDEPIRLYFYFSEDAAREIPAVMDHGERVRDLLEEYVLHSGGNLVLEVIDPEPFSEEEEQAVAEGIAGVPLGTGDPLYFGLVATNATDDREVIPFFDPFDSEKERFLEYDVSRIIYTLANPDKDTLGIISSLPVGGGAPSGNPFQPQQPKPRWKILDLLGNYFDVELLDPYVEEIPERVDVLLLIHPKGMQDKTAYAIDQFVLGGGKLLCFVDPLCEVDDTAVNPMEQMSALTAPRDSDLPKLFEAWGIELATGKLAADRRSGSPVVYSKENRRVQTRYIVWLSLEEENFDTEDAVTSLLDTVAMRFAGVLRHKPDATTTFEPLITTSEESMEIEASMIQFRSDPEELLAAFVPGYEKLTLAARLTGEVQSAFPDGRPEAADPEEAETEEEEGEAPDEEEADAADAHIASGSIQVIVVSDVDVLTDGTWIEEQRLGNLVLGSRVRSSNGDFLVNAVENLQGGEAIGSIRARGRFTRPFDRVEEIRIAAEKEHLSKQHELESRLQEAEQNIQALQKDKDPSTAMILSPEQEAELHSAQQVVLETKRGLRDVQHALRSDIEALGSRLKWINIGLVPLIVCAMAVALGAWRIQRRTTP